LLVDDNEDFLDSTKDVLEEEGYAVQIAASGEEAIRKVEESSPDLVVMDIKMPGMNGVESFTHMKRLRPGIRVIMCTAYIVDGLIRQALEEGAYSVLNKPFEMELLLNTIAHCLQEQNSGVILLADEDKFFCDKWARILRGCGHRVAVAHNGVEALGLARNNAFDVLILQLNLPKLNALEIHKRLQAEQHKVLATVILGSPHELDAEVHQMLRQEHGLITFSKPMEQAGFLDLLGSICAAKSLGEVQ